MAKSYSTVNTSKLNRAKSSTQKKRKSVEVVIAPSSFPNFASFSSSSSTNHSARKFNKLGNDKSNLKSSVMELDFNETVKEIHALGSTLFTGKQKRQYEAEKYMALTGREMKKQKVPLKIVRGIKKAAAKREARKEKEALESGVVTATKRKDSKKKNYSEKSRRDSRLHGPSPSIGFTKNGMLHVRKGGDIS